MANLSDLIAQSTSDNPQKLVNLALATQMMGSGSGLGGTNYIFVKGGGTPQENALELQAAYNEAKTMSPSSGNIITVVVAPGTYTFGATKFRVNTAYIDVVSLTGNADVLLDGVNVTANNVYLKGLNCGISTFGIDDYLDKLVCERCVGGNSSFGGGSGGTALGTFTDCTGGTSSFGGAGGTASGIFTNCTGGDNSFGGEGGTASGKFYNCKAGNDSYGSDNEASGEFYNCIGGEFAFAGGEGVASGKFYNCKGGKFSFGGNGQVSGEFYNCIGDKSSFGGDEGIISGKLYYCKLTEGEYEANKSGKVVLCIDGNDTVVTTP